jgi:hypothetical protein
MAGFDDLKKWGLKDATISGRTFTHIGDEEAAPMSNAIYGGQFGFSTEIGKIDTDGIRRAEFISSQAHVPRDMIVYLIKYPLFFDLMPDPQFLKDNWKAIIEEHSENITGIDTEVTVETEDNELGGSNSIYLDEVVGSVIARSQPVYEFTEKLGRPIGRFLKEYIMYGILDPYTRVALIGSISPAAREYFKHNLYTIDFYSFMALYVEPDTTCSHVVDAALHIAAYPKNSGEGTMTKNKQTSKTIQKLSINMAGPCITGRGIHAFAQKRLDEQGVRNTEPLEILPFEDVDPDISDAVAQTGFNSGNGNTDFGQ